MKKTYFLFLVSFAIIPVICISANRANNSEVLATSRPISCMQDSTLLNKPAPDFELQDLHGVTYSLKNLKGKVVVLNFWFVACKPCVNEMPVLNKIKGLYDPNKVAFLALALDNKEAINAFLLKHQFNYSILPNAGDVGKKYNLYAYPTSMVINARRIISFVQIGGPNIAENLPLAINNALKN